MRTRMLVLAALLSLPATLAAQRLPVGPRRTAPEPAPLPPEVAPVSRALAYHRARWSAEGYGLISNVVMSAGAGGGATSFTTFGAGTRADYRYTNNLTATVDITGSSYNSPAVVFTAEVGTRYMPAPQAEQIRPYFDLRGGFMNMFDTYPVTTNQSSETARYSRGFGGVAGAGMEMSVSNDFAVTTEVSAMRNRMMLYRLNGAASFPNGTNYWLTSVRYQIGIKYNPLRALHSTQNLR